MDKLIYTRRNPRPRKRRPTRITIPDRTGPHVKLVFAEMQRQHITYDEVEDGSGVLRTTLKAWRVRNAPSLTSLEAVFGFMGWDFIPIPRNRALSPDIVAELRPIAERLGLEMPRAIEAVMTIAAGIADRFPVETVPPPLAAEPEVLIPADRSGAEMIVLSEPPPGA